VCGGQGKLSFPVKREFSLSPAPLFSFKEKRNTFFEKTPQQNTYLTSFAHQQFNERKVFAVKTDAERTFFHFPTLGRTKSHFAVSNIAQRSAAIQHQNGILTALKW